MDINTLTQIISSIGFPICVCIYLIYNQNKDKIRQDEQQAKMNEILNNFSLNIQENTLLLKEIQSNLRGDDKDE